MNYGSHTYTTEVFLTELLGPYIQTFYNLNGYVVPDAGETDGLDNVPTILKQMVFLCRGVLCRENVSNL